MAARQTISSIGVVLQDFALGGTERTAVRLAGAWARLGISVTVYCGERAGPLSALLDPLVHVVCADPPIVRNSLSPRRLGKSAARHFAAQPVDACFIPGNYHWPAVPAVAGLSQRPAVVVQVSAALSKPQRGWLRKRLFDWRMRRLLRHADGIVTLSDPARNEATTIIGMRAEVRRIPLPALEDDAPPATKAAGRLVVAAGRLVPEKGFATLIDAFARLSESDVDLAIVGAGPDETRLKAVAAAAGVDERVIFSGYQPNIRPWLDRARLFVLSSQFEGYPAVLIEALAAGRPIVATDCTPAAHELLDRPDVGRVVPIDDAAAMARAIDVMLAAPPPDPDALAARVAQHRLMPVAKHYLAFFADLADRRSR